MVFLRFATAWIPGLHSYSRSVVSRGMKSIFRVLIFRRCITAVLLVLFSMVLSGLNADTDKSEEIFSSPALDLGIVVDDLEASASFYKNVLGCKEVKGFTASADLVTSIGLVDNMEVVARVFVLASGEKQSRLKMMAFPKAKVAKPDQTFIHSSVGFSYLTLHVKDLTAVMQRLKKAEIKFLGNTPVSLGGANALLVVRDPDGNFVELIGPITD